METGSESMGTACEQAVPVGDYTVEQISAPNGYVPNIPVGPFTVSAGTDCSTNGNAELVQISDQPGLF